MESIGHGIAKWGLLFTMALGMVFFYIESRGCCHQYNRHGSWTHTIDKSNLTGGAGTVLTSTYTSAQNVNLVSITGAKNKNDNWQVNIQRIDTTWNSSLQISPEDIKRYRDRFSIGGPGVYPGNPERFSIFFRSREYE